jgi:hypothetical protein
MRLKREVEVMASPWKFLVRLVSPRPLRNQDDGSIDVKPDVAAMAGQIETPVKEHGDLVEQLTREERPSSAQSEPVSAKPEPSVETGGYIQGNGKSNNGEGAETSNPSSLDTRGTVDASATVDETARAAPAKTRGRARNVEAVAVVSQTPPIGSIISDKVSLDQEIKVLRNQLVSRLRVQNAQLKRMLERFER